MNGTEKIEIATLLELKYANGLSHWLLLLRINNKYYLAIHNHQSAIVYRQVHNTLVANLIISKLHGKLSRLKDYKRTSGLLSRAFRFKNLFQTLFLINIHGMKWIHPNYVTTLTKRYNLKGDAYFNVDENNEITAAIIEVRFPPRYELFGKFISYNNETHYKFYLHRKFRRMLRAQK